MIRSLLICFVAAAAGCIHPATSAERYQAGGSFTLAMEYQNIAFEKEGREDASELIRNIELTRVRFKEKLDGLEKEKGFERAHALMIEWVEFERWIARLRVPGVVAKDLSQLLESWRLKASNSLVAQVDESISDEEALLMRLKLLRHAYALSPSDRELSQRYERLKGALSRDVNVVVQCSLTLAELCQEIRGLWLELFSRVRRELVHTVGEDTQRYDTKLLIMVDSRGQEEPWQVVRADDYETNVKLFNQFREPLTDSDGNVQTKTVYARSKVEESWRKVSVRAELQWTDLRAKGEQPRSFRAERTHESRVQYLKWSGDPRALEQNGVLDRFETNRRDPVSSEILQRRGVTEIVAELFNTWVKEVDQ